MTHHRFFLAGAAGLLAMAPAPGRALEQSKPVEIGVLAAPAFGLPALATPVDAVPVQAMPMHVAAATLATSPEATLPPTAKSDPRALDPRAPGSPTGNTPALNTPAAGDPRIRTFAYKENEVYRLDLFLRSVTALQFSASEEVQSILIGDSASWEVVKLKSGNVVSIKPIIAGASTNMTIYTDRRVYSFDLRSPGVLPPGAEASSLSRTVFTYPAEKEPKAGTLPAAPITTDYMVAGKARFRPMRVQDDGRQTTFMMPPGAPRPAIFKVGFDRKEALVNSRTRGNLVIVDGLSDFWVLRIGDESVCIGRSGAVRERRGFLKILEVSRAGQ